MASIGEMFENVGKIDPTDSRDCIDMSSRIKWGRVFWLVGPKNPQPPTSSNRNHYGGGNAILALEGCLDAMVLSRN